MFFPTFQDKEQREKISPFYICFKPKDTVHLVRKMLTVNWSCKLIKTNSNISRHVVTHKMKFLRNVDMKLCEIIVGVNLALNQ